MTTEIKYNPEHFIALYHSNSGKLFVWQSTENGNFPAIQDGHFPVAIYNAEIDDPVKPHLKGGKPQVDELCVHLSDTQRQELEAGIPVPVFYLHYEVINQE